MNGVFDFLNDIIDENNVCQHKDSLVNITEEAIKKVQYIRYPELTREECSIIRELAAEVLQVSKNENESKEVVITFSLEYEKLKNQGDIYKSTVKGDLHEVNVMADTDSYHIINSSDKVAVVNLHNHPCCEGFSLNDTTFFLQNPSIKLMVLVSNKGKVSFMEKNERFDYQKNKNLFMESIFSVRPDIKNTITGSLKKIEFSSDDNLKINRLYMRKAHQYGLEYRQEARERSDYYER